MSRLLAALRDDSPPYILTLFLAALGWYVIHVVDRARESPIVEAWFDFDGTRANQHRAVLEIENLSDRLFVNTSFQITGASGAGISITRFGRPTAVAPAVPMSENPTVENGNMAFVVSLLQPENHLRIPFYYVGSGSPVLLVTGSSTAMVIVKPSLITFFVRDELLILFGLIIIFGAATVLITILK